LSCGGGDDDEAVVLLLLLMAKALLCCVFCGVFESENNLAIGMRQLVDAPIHFTPNPCTTQPPHTRHRQGTFTFKGVAGLATIARVHKGDGSDSKTKTTTHKETRRRRRSRVSSVKTQNYTHL